MPVDAAESLDTLTAEMRPDAATTLKPDARRVLLKLSGEAFGGGSVGVDPFVVRRIASEIAAAARQGVQVAIVVGGGNYFRGASLSEAGMDRSRADYMGMLGTVMNCLSLQDFLEKGWGSSSGANRDCDGASSRTLCTVASDSASAERPGSRIWGRRGHAVFLY